MRILVTNDDGVSAEGLAVAEAIAAEIAGPEGETWVAAPAFEQSGVSHAISYTSPIKLEKLGERRFALAGTPADCVIVSMHHLMVDTPPDLVISGVNRGHNIGEDAVYSGTVGGAIEGALQGVKAIALSQYYRRPRPDEEGEAALFAPARAHGAEIVRRLLALDWRKDQFFNVNFPAILADEVKGVRTARQGRRWRGGFGAEARESPSRKPYFWIRHLGANYEAGEEDDCRLCAEGWITVTPMIPDYTDFETMAGLDAVRRPL